MAQLHVSDLEKIQDAVLAAHRYHHSRDNMNAAQHLGTPRYSPLTSVLLLAAERLESLVAELRDESPDSSGPQN
ncbi:MAG: hypothetical protein LC650_00845 [Actinobacteria bacterium]|nr:hypothetical protein [Actinomycetota bacterium]